MSRRPVDIKDKQVLDLVAAGESNGDYNAVYGIRVGSSQQPDFSTMTISEVRQYQRDRISSGQQSSAVGKYQFIQTTLDETTERAGFNPDTTYFTPEVQDQLMTTRLDQRGLSRWKSGRMSDTQFQDSLAKEFASVPVATAQQGAHKFLQPGDGYYDGDGLNSASHVDATKFSNNLAQINNESGTKFVNGDVDTGESADANTGNWTPPVRQSTTLMTPTEEARLAQEAANGNEQAAAELVESYKAELRQYMKDNPDSDPYQAPINDRAMALEDGTAAERQIANAINEAADTVFNETVKPTERSGDGQGMSVTVDDGNILRPLEEIQELEQKFYNRDTTQKRSPEPNWYTSVDLPTYRWTFYLTSKKVFDAPEEYLKGDTLNPTDAIIIAQDGVEATYTIDNFLFNATLFGDDTKGSAQTSTIQFELREPMGFTLLDAILTQSGRFNFSTMKDATYVLKLEFMGRHPLTGRTVKYDGIHFFPVQPYQITSDTGPEGTTYMFTCLTVPSLAAIENASSAGEVHVKQVGTLGELTDKLQTNLNRTEKLALADIPDVPPNNGYNEQDGRFEAARTQLQQEAVDSETIKPRKQWYIEFADTSAQQVAVGSLNAAHSGFDGFDLESMQISLPNTSGTAKNLDNADKIDTALPVNSNVVSWLKRFIIKQPAWNEYVMKASDSSYSTPTLEITQSIKARPGLEDEIDPKTQQRYIDVTISIGIKHRYGVVPPTGKNNAELSDSKFQKDRFEELPIVKKYDYLFTGTNTEVLNYSAQFNMLFTLAKDPRFGYNTANSQQDKQPTVNVTPTFLSNIAVDASKENVIVNLPIDYVRSSGMDQKTNEDTPTQNELFAQYVENFASRTADVQTIEVDVIGDPYLLGIPGATISGKESQTLKNVTATSDIFVAFLSYFPLNKNDIENPFDKGPMDLYTSGVYELREVEHRFQQGQYLTKLRMYRDHRTSTYYLQEELKNL